MGVEVIRSLRQKEIEFSLLWYPQRKSILNFSVVILASMKHIFMISTSDNSSTRIPA